MKIEGHRINGGYAEGEAVVYNGAFSFLGDLDPKTGLVLGYKHPLEGQSLRDKVFVFTTGRGSTFGPYYAFQAKQNGNAPAALICIQADTVIALSAITADIPFLDKLETNPLDIIKTGDHVKVDATKGFVTVLSIERNPQRLAYINTKGGVNGADKHLHSE